MLTFAIFQSICSNKIGTLKIIFQEAEKSALCSKIELTGLNKIKNINIIKSTQQS